MPFGRFPGADTVLGPEMKSTGEVMGIARSAWVRERVYALLCRSYADELSPLTDASIRDNATMLLKELKTKGSYAAARSERALR